MSKVFLTWGQTQYASQWGVTPYTWDDYSVFVNVASDYGSGGGGFAVPGTRPLGPIKARPLAEQEAFIKVVMVLNGKEYRGSKVAGKRGRRVTASDIKRAIEMSAPTVSVRIV